MSVENTCDWNTTWQLIFPVSEAIKFFEETFWKNIIWCKWEFYLHYCLHNWRNTELAKKIFHQDRVYSKKMKVRKSRAIAEEKNVKVMEKFWILLGLDFFSCLKTCIDTNTNLTGLFTEWIIARWAFFDISLTVLWRKILFTKNIAGYFVTCQRE